MKEIRINHITFPVKSSVYLEQRKYSVFLGNGVTKKFSNLKAAKRFLAVTNRYLNRKLHECNHIYVQIFTEYRKCWFFFTGMKGEKKMSMKRLEREIRISMKQIERAFELLVTRSGYENGNYFTWSHFRTIIDLYYDIIKRLLIVLRDRKYYAEIQTLEYIRTQAWRLMDDLEQYGKTNHSLKHDPSSSSFSEERSISSSSRVPDDLFLK